MDQSAKQTIKAHLYSATLDSVIIAFLLGLLAVSAFSVENYVTAGVGFLVSLLNTFHGVARYQCAKSIK